MSIRILLLLVMIFSLSACAKKKLKPNTDGPEVLMARDCGLDKLQCCADEPVCSFAQQCCVDPNDKNRNYCSDECGCGADGEFCCQGNKCNEGTTCYEGLCAACGGKDQPCCEGTGCGDGLSCFDGKCVACGVTGNPCCAGDKCADQSKMDKTRSECADGICRLCGSSGNVACRGLLNCLKGNMFSNDACYQCGGNNEPCCDKTSGLDHDCDSKQGLKCNLGFCSPAR